MEMAAKSMPTDGERLAVIDVQLKRVVSDMESEKRTRMESNRAINDHLLRQDTKIDSLGGTVSKGIGVIITPQFLIPTLVAVALAIWKN